jgi:hypothetical protein
VPHFSSFDDGGHIECRQRCDLLLENMWFSAVQTPMKIDYTSSKQSWPALSFLPKSAAYK